jgi:cyclic 2,3-diphosphoglycerate synthase
MRRAIAIIDGEHYPPVVRAALDELDDLVVAAVLVGGTEKLRGDDAGYGVPLEPTVEAAVERHEPEVVLDLSDEPVLGPRERLALASRVLALGLPYEGADFRFDPPRSEPVEVPTLAVIGTGKRVGKTAVTGHVARLLSSSRRVVVVAMGRGGPPEPETVVVPPTLDALLELSRSGRHASSDHLETAVVTGVPTVGARRCGGGLAGGVTLSNVREGVSVALELEPDLVVLDGSGAALPPIDAARRVLVSSAAQPIDVAAGYLNAYRARIADLVVVTMAEDNSPHGELADALRKTIRPGVPVIRAVLRPRPIEPVAGESVAFFCTAPPTQNGSRRTSKSRTAPTSARSRATWPTARRSAPTSRAPRPTSSSSSSKRPRWTWSPRRLLGEGSASSSPRTTSSRTRARPRWTPSWSGSRRRR